jgi:hypothetical protein
MKTQNLISAFCFLLSALAAAAAVHIQVDTENILGEPETNLTCRLVWVGLPGSRGNALLTVRAVEKQTGAGGSCTFSNVAVGDFRLDLESAPRTTFRLTVSTNLDGVYLASALRSTSNAPAAHPQFLTTATGTALFQSLLGQTNPGGGVPLRGEGGVSVTTVEGTNVAALDAAIALSSVRADQLQLKRWIAVSIEVSGAGESAANGYYSLVAEAPYTYLKGGTEDYIVTIPGNNWALITADGQSLLYTKGVGDSPVNGVWSDIHGGASPAPTVTFPEWAFGPLDVPAGGGVFWVSNAQPPFVSLTPPTLYWRTLNESAQNTDTVK